MVSLSLSIGPWNLNFELGKDEPSEELPEGLKVTLSDGTEIGTAGDPGPQAIAGYGFACMVGEAGPELWAPDEDGEIRDAKA